MPTVDPMSANTAAMREQTAIPAIMITPLRGLSAKNSCPIPRKIALYTPSTSMTLALVTVSRRPVGTAWPATAGLSGPISEPTWPNLNCSAATRKISVAKLNGRVKGGTPHVPRKIFASVAIKIVLKAETATM